MRTPRIITKRLFKYGALLSFISLSYKGFSQTETVKEFDLLLAGGGLSTCSSMSEKNCVIENDFNDALSEMAFNFSSDNKFRLLKHDFYLTLSDVDKRNLNAILEGVYATPKKQVVYKSELKPLLKKAAAYDAYLDLSDQAYYLFLDLFEHRQVDSEGRRLVEKVNLENNANPHSRSVYENFYQQASLKARKKGKTRPKLIAITASSRDPFESADFYTGVLNNFNADVLWLPIDRSLQQAWQIGSEACSDLEAIRSQNLLFNREAIYPFRTKHQQLLCLKPKLALEELSNADGLFLNGGDQSKTLAAFTDEKGKASPLLKHIRKLVNNKQLIVAGTSAGTAVQAGKKYKGKDVVMLSNGSPKNALVRGAFAAQPPSVRCSESQGCQQQKLLGDDLTYNKDGGLGLFSLGLLDTHFSERDREVRLSVFSHVSSNRFAFGVDEATALLVDMKKSGDINMEVVGESGVFILDSKNTPFELTKADDKANYVSGISHFINRGDQVNYIAKLDKLTFGWAPESAVLSQLQEGVVSRKGMWRKQLSGHCGSTNEISWTLFEQQIRVKSAANTEFALNKFKQCSYKHLPFVISQ